MFKSFFKLSFIFFILFFSINSFLRAEIINKIEIRGNDRISSETINMFAGISLKDDLNENDLNNILKSLYDSNFFEQVSVKLENNTLLISVKENPIIQNIDYVGIKSDTLLLDLKKNVLLKSRSSFNEITLKKDKENITKFLKDIGYYFSEIDISVEELKDNKVNLVYNISLGDKLKLKRFLLLEIKFSKTKSLKM